MSITAITPTGDRPLAFALCQIWMAKQTRQPDQWIVVDDGAAPLEPLGTMEYIRREPQPGEPKPTLIANLLTAVPKIKGDQIIFIEDDEYYAPHYLERIGMALAAFEVAGICRSKYYHLPTGKYIQIGNAGHASLAETGIRVSFLPDFTALLTGDSYLDMRIWRKAGSRGILLQDNDRPLYLGIKGLPGRPGIGAGHKPAMYGTRMDTRDRSVLRRWIPGDFQIYLDIITGVLTEANYKDYFQSRDFSWTAKSPA
jgi:hypothetical protein